ncbi:MAG TPA: hypothetical protein VJO13_15520 [Ktedonobacterales bacterium]|nr:hypothetical protein [Ktedonobacterales bacterium]
MSTTHDHEMSAHARHRTPGAGISTLRRALRPRWAQVALVAGLLLALAAGSLGLAHQANAATYEVCASGCAYTSINAAIAAAANGATVKVGPGTYGPGTSDVPITISKPINLVGAGIGHSIINGAPASAAISGLVTITPTTAGNVSVSGFTIEGAIVNDSNDDGILMTVTDHNASDVITVNNNLFYGDTTLDPQLLADQTDSIYIASNSATVNVKNNSFQGVFRAALIEGNPGAVNFTGNTLNLHGLNDISTSPATFGWWAEGVFFLADGNVDVTAPQVVSGNYFGNYPGLGVGVDAGYTGGLVGRYNNIAITGNVFNNAGVAATQSSTADDSAISLHGFGTTSGGVTSEIKGVSIKNNTFSMGSSSGHGYAISYKGTIGSGNVVDHNLIRGSGSSRPLAGFQLASPAGSAGVNITNNIISGFVNGLTSDALSSGMAVSAVQNCIMGNSTAGATVASGTSLTATQNWWGTASGPHAPTNASGTGNAANGSVTFSPFRTSQATICAGPVAKSVFTSPASPGSNTAFTLSGTLSDSTTGNFAIASGQYSINGGAYHAMSAKDGSFNQVTEGVTAHLNGLAAGRYTVCMRGADSAGNTGAADCFALTVYNLAATQTAAAIASVTVSPTQTASTDQPTATTVGGAGGSATPTPTSVGLVGGSGFPSLPVIIGGVAALIIVVSLLFLILARRRRDDDEEEGYPQRGEWRR